MIQKLEYASGKLELDSITGKLKADPRPGKIEFTLVY